MRSKRPYYFLAVFALPLLVVLQNPSVSEPLRGFSLTLLKPALLAGDAVAGWATGARDQTVYLWKTFREQGEKERRIAELESQLVALGELSKENERLRKLFDFRSTLSGKTIAARVIAWDPSPWRRTVVLDKGSQHGIKKDMAIIVPEGLVGRVIEVGPLTARAVVLTDPDSRVSAVTSDSRAQGMAAGKGSPQLRMIYLELSSNVAVGESVLSSGV